MLDLSFLSLEVTVVNFGLYIGDRPPVIKKKLRKLPAVETSPT